MLDEASSSAMPAQRTAEGYGRYTDEPADLVPAPSPAKAAPPPIARKPVVASDGLSGNPYPKTRPPPNFEGPVRSPPAHTASAPPMPTAPPGQPSATQLRVVSRPSVPPKAPSLRPGGASSKPQWPPPPSTEAQPSSSRLAKPSGGLAALLAKDLEGVPDYPPSGSSGANGNVSNREVADGVQHDSDAWQDVHDVEADFSKRYPSLSGIEMVETEIGGQMRIMRVRDV